VLGSEAAFVVDALDGQEDALRAGRRPGDGAWGVEPPERWGRLVRGDSEEPVPSEPGAWPAFYAGVERWLSSGGDPPVDPADAVRVLEVIEAARAVAAGDGA
jgi:scyllo-inositol 2-dehydrogenase (NADP+)